MHATSTGAVAADRRQARTLGPGLLTLNCVRAGPQVGKRKDNDMITVGHTRIHSIRGVAATATVLLLAGCGASTPVGAVVRSQASPRVLTFANGNDDVGQPLMDWASQVKKSSGGTLTIDFKSSWRLGQNNYEQGAVRDVKAAKVDMAWIGARTFDKVGVKSFQALLAPLLVDSYALESKVFQQGIPDRMLTGTDAIGLKGVGVLPGPLRKVLGVSKPLRATTDFKAQVVGIQDSGVAELTLRALGAEPRAVPSSAKLTGLDAYEQQLGSIAGNNYQSTAKYVTANLNLWPRPLVLVMNPKVFGSLTLAQQAALRGAATAATSGAITNARAEDASAVKLLCQGGMTLAQASTRELVNLRTALGQVYQQLEADPKTKTYLDQITTLKAQVSAAAEAPTCSGVAQAQQGDFPVGTFRTTLTKADALKGGPNLTPEANHGATILDLVVKHGNVTIFERMGGASAPQKEGFSGTYTVAADHIVFNDAIKAGWHFDGRTLIFTDVAGGPDDIAVWGSHPWTLVHR